MYLLVNLKMGSDYRKFLYKDFELRKSVENGLLHVLNIVTLVFLPELWKADIFVEISLEAPTRRGMCPL